MMFTWIRRFLAPPVFEDDEDKTRTASLLHTILLAIVTVAVMYGIASLFTYPDPGPSLVAVGTVVLLGLGAQFLMRSGRVQLTSVLLSSAVWVLMTLVTSVSGGVRAPGFSTHITIIVIASLLLGGRAGIVYAGLSALAGLGILYAEINGILPPPRIAITSVSTWVEITVNFVMTSFLLYLASRSIINALERARRDERALAESLGELQVSRDALEAYTGDLERRSIQLEVAAQVAREAAAIREVEQLLEETVRLISNRFGFYHAGIFLVDEAGEYAVLRAASSEGGQRMLAREHKLKVGEVGIVGYVTGTGQPRIALDVGEDAFFDSSDLPLTRSKMALPLKVRERVIGALDVQSREPEAFSEEDVAVLQTLADQVAIAIENARLLRQAQESLEAERRAYGEISRKGWAQMVRARPDLGYFCNPQGIHAAEGQWRPEMVQAGQAGRTVQADGTTVAVPIKVRDQVAGVVRLRKPDDAGGWTAEEVALMETLTDQLGVALESARLYQDTQRRAAQERLTGEVTARMRETLELETVLKTAVQEVRQALGLPEVIIRLTTSPPSPRTTGNDRNGDEPARSDGEERIV